MYHTYIHGYTLHPCVVCNTPHTCRIDAKCFGVELGGDQIDPGSRIVANC